MSAHPLHGALGSALDRPVCFLDLETTGLSLKHDRIVELAVLIVHPDGTVEERERRFNPEMPIPPEASRVHGITDADVADEAPFRQRARALAEVLDPCDLAGFNIRRFDLPMLITEFRRAGITFDVRSRRLIDVQLIFHREEPRDLTAAAQFYLGRTPEDAHTALADIRTSADVFAAQLLRYTHLPRDLDGLHRYCDDISPFETEFDRWFERDGEGALVFRRGKHRGRRLKDIAAQESDYLVWMLSAEDMDPEVLIAVEKALHAPVPDPTQEPLPLPGPPEAS
ncbi:MAG: 3'-5' exonuclease [Gemmatimonadota bacterium]|nr:3'-5' exonuclease [Gemmatimonadota bacterium]